MQKEKCLDAMDEQGGRVVAIGNAVRAFAAHDAFSLTRRDEDDTKTAYGDREREAIRSSIYGSIYKANVDSPPAGRWLCSALF